MNSKSKIFSFFDDFKGSGRFSFFKDKNVIKSIAGTILYDATFVVATLNMIVNNLINSNKILFLYLAMRKVIRIFSDIPAGKLIDRKINIKNGIIIAMLLKALFIASIALQNKYVLFFGIFCEGVSLSFFRGKVSIFHYRVLQSIGKEGSYPLLNTVYTFLIYIFTIINSSIGIYLVHTKSPVFASLATTGLLVLSAFLVLSVNVKFENQNQVKQKRSIISAMRNTNTKITRQVVFLSVLLGICCLGWELNTLNQFLTLKLTNSPKYSSIVFQYNSIAMMIGAVLAILLYNKSIKISSLIFLFVLGFNAIVPNFIKIEHVPLVFITYALFFNIHENLLKTYIINHVGNEEQAFVISISTTVTSFLTIMLQAIFMIFGENRNPIYINSIIFSTLTVIALISTLNSAQCSKNNLDKSRQG